MGASVHTIASYENNEGKYLCGKQGLASSTAFGITIITQKPSFPTDRRGRKMESDWFPGGLMPISSVLRVWVIIPSYSIL